MGSTIDKNASTSQSKAVIPEIGHEYMKMKKKARNYEKISILSHSSVL